MKRVAIYYRVSIEDQKPDLQVDELRGYAKQRKFKVVGEYVDKVSGAAHGQSWMPCSSWYASER